MDGKLTKMSVYYECVKCGICKKSKSHMIKHFYRKNQCKWKNIEDKGNYKSETEVYQDCIKKRYKNSDKIYDEYKQVKEEINTEIVKHKNIDPYISKCLFKNVTKKKEYKCEFCKKIFKEKFNMKVHLSSCRIKKIVESKENIESNDAEMDTKEEETKENIVSDAEDENITETIINSDVYIPLLRRFYEAVDISHISEEKHIQNMLYSSYEKIFLEIMRNERNMNFFMSLESSDVIIYKDEINDVKKEKLENAYSRICMNIHEYLMNQIEKLKVNSYYDQDHVKIMEKKFMKMNKKHRFNDECKNKFLTVICEFCREKKNMIFARFTQNFIANQQHLIKP